MLDFNIIASYIHTSVSNVNVHSHNLTIMVPLHLWVRETPSIMAAVVTATTKKH